LKKKVDGFFPCVPQGTNDGESLSHAPPVTQLTRRPHRDTRPGCRAVPLFFSFFFSPIFLGEIPASTARFLPFLGCCRQGSVKSWAFFDVFSMSLASVSWGNSPRAFYPVLFLKRQKHLPLLFCRQSYCKLVAKRRSPLVPFPPPRDVVTAPGGVSIPTRE